MRSSRCMVRVVVNNMAGWKDKSGSDKVESRRVRERLVVFSRMSPQHQR